MTETIPPPSGPGTVLLNLDARTGALILYAPPELNAREIEITSPGVRTHSQVRERRVNGPPCYAAVYPGLAAADYTIWRDESTPIATVVITAGQVTSFTWPA